MYESITVLEERLLALKDLLDSKICKEDTDFKTWIEKEQLPRLMLEYMGRSGCNIDLLKEKKMNLAELSTQPAGTSADIQVQVTQLLNSGTNTYGPWCKVKIEDASGTQDIMCTGALQVNQVYTLAMKWKNDPKYGMQLSGKITNGQLAPSPPPSQTPADTDQYKAAPTATPPAAAAAPPVVQAPVASAQQSLKPELTVKDKSIMVQVAAQITRDLISAGKGPERPGECVHAWTHYMIDAYNSIGIAGQGFPAAGPDVGDGSDKIPY